MKGIIGAICGDIIGSTREHYPIKTKDFDLFPEHSTYTDDTILTLAVANWLIKDRSSEKVLVDELQYFGNTYPTGGYGGNFSGWLQQENPEPYGSWANGSAMRVSPCAWVAESLEEAQELAYTSAVVTHNHPDGIKGALTTCDAIYLARIGAKKEEIKDHIELRYGYNLSRSLNEIRPDYTMQLSCKLSVPESIICFLEARDFEDAIRNAVSLGGDADTQAAIAGSIASAYWDVPEDMVSEAVNILDDRLLNVLIDFEEKFI